MDLVTQADLEILARRDLPEEHLSLFIPTHRAGEGVSTDRIRWKNLLKQVEAVLKQRGGRAHWVEELLSPAWALYEDSLAWQYMSEGLAMFVRPGWHRSYRVPAGVPEIATVGSRFVTAPLLRVLTEGSHFLVLVLSQQKVRLLEAGRQQVDGIDLGDVVPTSLREVVEPREPRSDAMARPVAGSIGGRRSPAVFYGYGAADDQFRTHELRRFLQVVAKGLREYLRAEHLPMVLIGLDEAVSIYRSDVDVYPHVIDRDVRRNPDQLSAAQVHAFAWEAAEKFFAQRLVADTKRFDDLYGTGLASNDPVDIEAAAASGRIDTLFVATEPWCWEKAESDNNVVVQLGEDAEFSHCEMLDRIATDTWSRSGHVHAIAEPKVPGGGDVAAIFRY